MWDQLTLRQRDRLPTFSVEIIDDDGSVLPLDAVTMVATATFIGQRTGIIRTVDCVIEGSTIVYDWQEDDLPAEVDTYDVIVGVTVTDPLVDWEVTAPTRRRTVIVVRPLAPAGDVPPPDTQPLYWDDLIAQNLWDDPLDQLRWRP